MAVDSRRTAWHVDNILHALGPRGPYQLLQTFAVSTSCFASSHQLLSNIFTSQAVEHKCAPFPNETDFVSKYAHRPNVSVEYGKCDIQARANGSVLFDEPCLFGFQYSDPVGMSARSQFDLVCDRDNLARLTQTLVIAGQLVGASTATIISDRVGRKPIMVLSNLGLFFCGMIIAYAPNYAVFAIFKFLVGACQQGTVISTSTLVTELFPIKDRRLCTLLLGGLWSISVMVMTGTSYLLSSTGWRTTQMIYSLNSLTAVFIWWYAEESIRWLFANGQYERAVKVIRRAAAKNNKNFENVMEAYEGSEEFHPQKVEATQKLSLLDLVRHRRLLTISVAVWFAWFSTALGYFALYTTVSSLSGDFYLNMFLTSCMELPSNIFFFWSLNALGRRVSTAIPFATLSVGLLLTGLFKSLPASSAYDVLSILTSLMSMLGAAGCFGAVYAYTPELFPTNIRNQAFGMASAMGRVGGMLAPFTELLAQKAIWLPGVLIGGCACLVCLGLTVLPETAHRELPQTLQDLEEWYRPQRADAKRNTKRKKIDSSLPI